MYTYYLSTDIEYRWMIVIIFHTTLNAYWCFRFVRGVRGTGRCGDRWGASCLPGERVHPLGQLMAYKSAICCAVRVLLSAVNRVCLRPYYYRVMLPIIQTVHMGILWLTYFFITVCYNITDIKQFRLYSIYYIGCRKKVTSAHLYIPYTVSSNLLYTWWLVQERVPWPFSNLDRTFAPCRPIRFSDRKSEYRNW